MGHARELTGTAKNGPEGGRSALERVLASPEFLLSPRMSQLLKYLVDATLSDRSGELKETVVGVDVFGRPPDYDPKADPVVRKEARRLRQKLQEYYQGTGAAEILRIDVPKGGYSVVFTAHELPPVAEPQTSREYPPGRWNLVRPMTAVAVLLMVGTVVALRVDKPVVVPTPLTGNGGSERFPALSPDGRNIAFSWESPSDSDSAIYTQALAAETPKRLTASRAHEDLPAWSPDSRRLAFLRRTESGRWAVVVRDRTTGLERILTDVSAASHLDWSPEGRTIAVSDTAAPGVPPSILFLSVENGGRRQMTIPGRTGDSFPRFSPDGSRLAFLRAIATDVNEIYVISLGSSSEPRRLTFENHKIEGFTWSPDSRSLLISLARGSTARSLWRVSASGGSMERVAAAGTGAYFPTWSSNGVLAFVQQYNDVNLYRIRTDSAGVPARVADSSSLDSCPTISSDGRVAFRSLRSGTNEIWITGLFESAPRRLTHMNGPLTGSPQWSPDSRSVIFDSRANGVSNIWLASSIGGDQRRLTDGPSNSLLPRWSRSGEWIYFASDRGGRWQVWKQRPAGGAAEQVTWKGGYAAAESPDGQYLYYTRSVDESGLFRIPLGGGEEEAVLPGLAGKLWGNWAPTSQGIYYLDYPERDPLHSAIRFLDIQTHETREVFRLPKHPVLWDGGLALSPDGQWLVFAELDRGGSNIQLLQPFP